MKTGPYGKKKLPRSKGRPYMGWHFYQNLRYVDSFSLEPTLTSINRILGFLWFTWCDFLEPIGKIAGSSLVDCIVQGPFWKQDHMAKKNVQEVRGALIGDGIFIKIYGRYVNSFSLEPTLTSINRILGLLWFTWCDFVEPVGKIAGSSWVVLSRALSYHKRKILQYIKGIAS